MEPRTRSGDGDCCCGRSRVVESGGRPGVLRENIWLCYRTAPAARTVDCCIGRLQNLGSRFKSVEFTGTPAGSEAGRTSPASQPAGCSQPVVCVSEWRNKQKREGLTPSLTHTLQRGLHTQGSLRVPHIVHSLRSTHRDTQRQIEEQNEPPGPARDAVCALSLGAWSCALHARVCAPWSDPGGSTATAINQRRYTAVRAHNCRAHSRRTPTRAYAHVLRCSRPSHRGAGRRSASKPTVPPRQVPPRHAPTTRRPPCAHTGSRRDSPRARVPPGATLAVTLAVRPPARPPVARGRGALTRRPARARRSGTSSSPAPASPCSRRSPAR
jgi:hypothetical protein